MDFGTNYPGKSVWNRDVQLVQNKCLHSYNVFNVKLPARLVCIVSDITSDNDINVSNITGYCCYWLVNSTLPWSMPITCRFRQRRTGKAMSFHKLHNGWYNGRIYLLPIQLYSFDWQYVQCSFNVTCMHKHLCMYVGSCMYVAKERAISALIYIAYIIISLEISFHQIR